MNAPTKFWNVTTAFVIVLICAIVIATVKVAGSIPYTNGSNPNQNTITVNGTGNAYAIPNIATFSFTVSDTEKTVVDAQTKTTAAEKSTLAVVRAAGVADKDIQTQYYSISPQYQYQNAVCPEPAVYNSSVSSATAGSASVSNGVMVPSIVTAPSTATAIYCPSGKSVLTGYQVSESISVKLRDLSKAGSLLASLGSAGVSNLNGPSFDVDNPDSVNAQARSTAITDAQSKAKELAKELGVSLVRITSFSENNGSYPQPIMYAMSAGTGSTKAAAPEIATGQQEVSDNVTITYEIR
jgi:uncharacterized protein YggE